MRATLRAWRERGVVPVAGAVASGVLTAAAFAPLEWSDTAWCGLVPLILACAYVTPRQAVRLGWIAGFTFWLCSIFWLTRVTFAGWLLLSAYCALYTVPLAVVVSWWFGRFGAGRFLPNAAFLLGGTAVWTFSEYARFTLFTGFPWNPLGVSQATNLAFIQHAVWGGVYAVGALVAVANMAIAVTVLRYLRGHARFGRTPHIELLLAMSLILVAFVTGTRLYRAVVVVGDELRVAVVQPAIPQEEKWSVESEEMIYTRLRDLTLQAVEWTQPDLVVWPETALPVDVRLSEGWYELVDRLARLGTPILVGSMDSETLMDGQPRYYNSSFLFATNGMIVGEYDKNHLVLFGEYVPLHEYVDIVNALTPVMESFSPGDTNTVFELPGRGTPFSALICFEDSLPYLARRSVRNGARLLINQTNDAWFDPSAASRQHQLLAVFRAVENRVPMVRSANTGYSCHIEATGRIRETLVSEGGRHDGAGFLLVPVVVPPAAMPLTWYTRHGDVFAWVCGVVALPFLVPAFAAVRRRRRDEVGA
ncbi:MAG TPA: apolipoprotein N-acyltransferase [Kiritimatiellia bacterium]|nr:apolipoprotein N-acyltransferase [Kiritimatiellia bacterium]HMP34161.1 apolipoprotein N-acyltransferase [Kiritimatiellia bacterium]